MGEKDEKQLIGENIYEEQKVALLRRLRTGTEHAAERGDPGQRNDAGELMDRGESDIAHYGRAPELAAIESGELAPNDNAAGYAARIATSERSEQLALVLLER